MCAMGLFGKLFGKKDDDLGLRELDKSLNMPTGLNMGGGQSDSNLGLGNSPYGTGMPNQPSSYGSSPFDSSAMQAPQMQSVQDQNVYAISKELEVISIKLDAIKMAIESLSQRLANIERSTYGDQVQSQYSYPQQQQRYYRDSPPRSY